MITNNSVLWNYLDYSGTIKATVDWLNTNENQSQLESSHTNLVHTLIDIIFFMF